MNRSNIFVYRISFRAKTYVYILNLFCCFYLYLER